MSLYLIRHGSTAFNRESGSNIELIRGWLPLPLHDKGIQESERIGEFLKDKNIVKLVTSDLPRAVQTAECISKKLNLKINEYMQALRPWNLGVYQGQNVNEVHKVIAYYIREEPNTTVQHGENFSSFLVRYLTCLKMLMNDSINLKGNLAAILHFRNIKAMQGHIAAVNNGNSSFDVDIFLKNDLEASTIFELNFSNSKWQYKKVL